MQRYSQGLTAIGVGTLFTVTLIPQSLGLKKYRKTLAVYKENIEQPIDQVIFEIATKVRYAAHCYMLIPMLWLS